MLSNAHIMAGAVDDASIVSKRVDSDNIIADLMRDAGGLRGQQ